MKMMMMLAVVAGLGMASMAVAQTGNWHRSPVYDTGNANRPCPMLRGEPCPMMKDGEPCMMMKDGTPCPMEQGKPCPMMEDGKPCTMMLKKSK